MKTKQFIMLGILIISLSTVYAELTDTRDIIPATPNPPQTDIVLEGFIYFGFEQREFHVLETLEKYWIKEMPDSVYTIYRELHSQLPEGENRYAIYVKVEADISEEGHFGHFGGYKREVILIDVIEIRLSTDEERKLRISEKK
jgi:hypothetical protein